MPLQVGKLFHLNVLGKGPDRLALPTELQQHVTLHRRLHYKPFYNTIAANIALVPSLASDKWVVLQRLPACLPAELRPALPGAGVPTTPPSS